MSVMKCCKVNAEEQSLTNRVVVNGADFPANQVPHVKISTSPGVSYVMSTLEDGRIPRGQLGFGKNARQWAVLSLGQDLTVEQYRFDLEKNCVSTLTVEVDFYMKKNTSSDDFNSDKMTADFCAQFANIAVTQGQPFLFKFEDKPLLLVKIKELEASDLRKVRDGEVSKYSIRCGVLLPNTAIVWHKGEESTIKLTGKSRAKMERQSIINPNWDFSTMGIGGLDEEFNAIFRRAFASRVFPPEIMEQLGCSHVKGILLHGPPGTGKTLMARQIGKMLNAKEPKIVNGPEIFNKFIGESEANIRKLFEEAEDDERRLGVNSPLHIIIFDEIDAICKKRGSEHGMSGVNDTVVNQLLSKIDGVDRLNNILVIGMTNRPDMIDDALTRPGRLEVQVEIGLPREDGRVQILNIHTNVMKQNKKLADDVNMAELAALTKNFSGAELEGLVRAAQSCALNRLVKADGGVSVDTEAIEHLRITRADFLHALDNDIKPALGSAQDLLEGFLTRGIIDWSSDVSEILTDGKLAVQQAMAGGSGLVSLLLEGAPNAGKSALAAKIAKDSGFPFIKICSPENMIGFTESAKCMTIRKIFDDAYKSAVSCVVVDNIERLIDYGPIGPRYANMTLQALLVLLKKMPPKGRKLLIIATTSRKQVLDDLEMISAFTDVLHVPNLSRPEHVTTVAKVSNVISPAGMTQLQSQLSGRSANIGVKKLLGLLDMVHQTEEKDRVDKLITKLEEEMFISLKV